MSIKDDLKETMPELNDKELELHAVMIELLEKESEKFEAITKDLKEQISTLEATLEFMNKHHTAHHEKEATLNEEIKLLNLEVADLKKFIV